VIISSLIGEWTPKKAGVYQLLAGSQSRNVSVRFSGMSWSGIGLMALAAALLFGGAGWAFRTLFRDGEEEQTIDYDPIHHPDT